MKRLGTRIWLSQSWKGSRYISLRHSFHGARYYTVGGAIGKLLRSKVRQKRDVALCVLASSIPRRNSLPLEYNPAWGSFWVRAGNLTVPCPGFLRLVFKNSGIKPVAGQVYHFTAKVER